jgi:hypothetical protein
MLEMNTHKAKLSHDAKIRLIAIVRKVSYPASWSAIRIELAPLPGVFLDE